MRQFIDAYKQINVSVGDQVKAASTITQDSLEKAKSEY